MYVEGKRKRKKQIIEVDMRWMDVSKQDVEEEIQD